MDNRHLWLLTPLVITLSACQPTMRVSAHQVSPPVQVHFDPSSIPEALSTSFRNTYYYVVDEKDYPKNEAKDHEILDPQLRVLAYVSKRFRKDLLMEGSGILEDGRVLNYFGKVGEEHVFHETKHEMGRGAGNCGLIPFHSVAIDPTQVPLGAKIFIDETVGMVLPDGTIHDGIWYAHDTGGAILHDRVDLFIGFKKYAHFLSDHGITHMRPLTIRVLEKPDLFSCVNEEIQWQ